MRFLKDRSSILRQAQPGFSCLSDGIYELLNLTKQISCRTYSDSGETPLWSFQNSKSQL